MNDRVINPWHLEFCVNVGHVLLAFVSVRQKVSVHACMGQKVIFTFNLYLIFRFNLFSLFDSRPQCDVCARVYSLPPNIINATL